MLKERRCIEDIYFDVLANKALAHPKRRYFRKSDVMDAHKPHNTNKTMNTHTHRHYYRQQIQIVIP